MYRNCTNEGVHILYAYTSGETAGGSWGAFCFPVALPSPSHGHVRRVLRNTVFRDTMSTSIRTGGVKNFTVFDVWCWAFVRYSIWIADAGRCYHTPMQLHGACGRCSRRHLRSSTCRRTYGQADQPTDRLTDRPTDVDRQENAWKFVNFAVSTRQ